MFLIITSATIAYFSKLKVYLIIVNFLSDLKPASQLDLWLGAYYVESKSSVAVTGDNMGK